MTAATRSGIPLQRFYAPEGSHERPGEFPFTRGRLANPHPSGTWIQRELSGEGDGARSNAQIQYLLSHGQTGIDVIGDAPTQAMMDPDHPLARDTVGTQGVSLCCKQDYLDMLAGVPLERISVSSSVPAIFSLTGLILAAREAGVPLDKLRGSTLQPPLYAEDCCYAVQLPVAFRVRISADCMAYCAAHLPRFHSYIEDTYFFSESGLTPVEEMALGFVEIRHLTRALIARGVPVDSFAPRIAILVNCGMDFFEEIAKIRATRRLYARMMRDEFGAKDPRSLSAAITSHTSGLSLTAQQPANNIVRGTIQAMALVLGGVQAMEISAFDEAYRTPSKEAHLVGLRTQQLIDLESGAGQVADPLGGAYFIEALTDEIEQRIRARVDEIEALGDAETLAEQGYFRDIFHRAMEESQRQIDTGEMAVIGLNTLRLPEGDDTLLRDVTDVKIEPWTAHIEKIKAFKATRDLAKVRDALGRIMAVSRSDDNLVPHVIAALEISATTGEITGAMRLALGMPWDPLGEPVPAFLQDLAHGA